MDDSLRAHIPIRLRATREAIVMMWWMERRCGWCCYDYLLQDSCWLCSPAMELCGCQDHGCRIQNHVSFRCLPHSPIYRSLPYSPTSPTSTAARPKEVGGERRLCNFHCKLKKLLYQSSIRHLICLHVVIVPAHHTGRHHVRSWQ